MKSKNRFMFISLVLLFPVSSFTQIKVLESTPSIVRLSWEIGGIDTVIVGSGDKQSVMLSFKGQNTVVGSTDNLLLPGYSIFTGVPPTGKVEVSVVAEQISSIQLPAPPYVNDSNGKPSGLRSFEFSTPWISQPVFEHFRGIRTAALIVRPAVYDEDTRVLRVMTRGTITIKLPAGVLHSTITGTSDFEMMLSQLLCNYPVATGWRTVSGALKKKKSNVAFPLDATKVYHFRVGDGSRDGFNEVNTLENGLMKIPGKVIVNTFGMVPVANVKLYASVKGELSDNVPDVDKIPDGVVEIPLLRIAKNKYGMVDSDDLFIAYVTGASDWAYENGDFKMKVDRYDDFRNYWLTTGNNGSSMAAFAGTQQADTVVHHFIQPCYFKKNNDIRKLSEGGLTRVWKVLTKTNLKLELPSSFPGIDTTLTGTFKINYVIPKDGALKLKFGDIEVDESNQYQYTVSSWSMQKPECEFVAQTESDYCEINDVNINYFRKMDITNHDMLTIFSMPDSLNYGYTINGLDGDLVYIVRVSANDGVELIDSVRNGSGDGTFSWVDRGMSGARYIVCREDNLLSLPAHEDYHGSSNVKHSIHDLRDVSNQTDYLIITDSAFAVQAETLSVHKVKMGFTNPAVVDVRDIYRLFSGGDLDPAAIRNFVQYVKNRWTNGVDLDYVLLLGNGHYDYKKKMKDIPIHIPNYYNESDQLHDDYFTVTEPNTSLPSCAIGRITCSTAREAAAVVRKIREYEDPELADFSSWRNRALFVADDDSHGDERESMNHHISSDRASDSLSRRWPSLDLRKVFLFEYEWDNTKRKPGATRAIINQINNGAGIVNYFGHGSYYVWSDEEALNTSDLGKLYNKKQYPVISSFSCSVGKFDQPGVDCLSGALVKLENAGAIATISSSRISIAPSNTDLAVNFYNQLIDSSTRIQSIGIMLVKGKIITISDTNNNRNYVLMGDPSIRIVKSARPVSLEVVNSKDSIISEIKSMQLVKIKGNVLSENGTVDNSYGTDKKPAFVQVGLFNPDDAASRKDGDTMTVTYVLPGSPVFLGKTKVIHGKFEQPLLIPRNVVFNKKGVKLTAYSWCEGKNDCGSGYRTGFVFNGSENGVANDTTGPSVSIQHYEMKNDQTPYSSSTILSLQLALYDPNGIDIIGTGPDEGLAIEITGLLAKRSISNNFQFKEGDFKSGTVALEIPLSKVNDEKYALIITSRDLMGNLSVTTFPLDLKKNSISEIAQDPDLDHTFNFPNPVCLGKTTRFFFYRSETNQRVIPYHYRFVVKIYTLNGKLVRVFKDAKHGEVWDCRDQRGKLLSPDTYLYQIQAYSILKKKTIKGKIEKIVIHPPT